MSADADRLRREARLLRQQGESQNVAAVALWERAEALVMSARTEAERLTADARRIADDLEEHAEALELRAADYNSEADARSLSAADLDDREGSDR